MADWFDIKFLESAANVRALIHHSTGRRPTAGISREVSVCIRQGRLFFEAAIASPIQIKPLLLYYGVVAFAQAVVIAKRNVSVSTLTRSHGLRDITPQGVGVEGLVVRCENAGTFQEFNDALAPLGRIWHYPDSMPQWFQKPFDATAGLSNQQISITEALSRIPGLSETFFRTFGSPGKSAHISLISDMGSANYWRLSIADDVLFTDRASLAATIQRWRTEYPFLERWRFIEAMHSWGQSTFNFDNADRQDSNDIAEDNLMEASFNGFTTRAVGGNPTLIPASEILPPLSGGYVGSTTYAMQPIHGVKLNEYSLQFLGSYMLSSLVRYRPQIWQNAISRSVTAEGPADDRALALIEKFLDGIVSAFPEMVVRVIDYQRTR